MNRIEVIDGRIAVAKDKFQNVLPHYEGEISASLTEKKKGVLNHYFSNVDGDVVAIRDSMPPIIAGALTARTSRAQNDDVREVFWNEFYSRPEFGRQLVKTFLEEEHGREEAKAAGKANDLIGRILKEYGDDSVREDASGYVAVKNHSVLSSMRVFREKLLHAIEASTRYIDWGKVENGEFRYLKNEKILQSPLVAQYWGTMDNLFNVYGRNWDEVWNHIASKNPQGDVEDLPYKSAVKGRVCDNLRRLLPLGIKTNYILHADYRTFSELILNLSASPLEEDRQIASDMVTEFKKVNPKFIEVVNGRYAEPWIRHRVRTREIIRDTIGTHSRTDRHVFVHANEEDFPGNVKLRVINKNWLLDLTKSLIDSEEKMSNRDLEKTAKKIISTGEINQVLKDLGDARTNRRHKVADAFQRVVVEVTFDNISFSSFKDFNRQRNILDKGAVDWSGKRGFYIPDDIRSLGGNVLDDFVSAQESSLELYQSLKDVFPEEAKLVLTHGAKTSVTIQMGLAEAFWIAELRSIASGDSEYRRFAQQLWSRMVEKMPELGEIKNFVDMEEYSLNRIGEAVRNDLARGADELSI